MILSGAKISCRRLFADPSPCVTLPTSYNKTRQRPDQQSGNSVGQQADQGDGAGDIVKGVDVISEHESPTEHHAWPERDTDPVLPPDGPQAAGNRSDEDCHREANQTWSNLLHLFCEQCY